MGVEGLQNESVITVMVCLGSGELGGEGGRREGEITNNDVDSTLSPTPIITP